jgi:hypothetical protein
VIAKTGRFIYAGAWRGSKARADISCFVYDLASRNFGIQFPSNLTLGDGRVDANSPVGRDFLTNFTIQMQKIVSTSLLFVVLS